jgi:hypothetical protein
MKLVLVKLERFSVAIRRRLSLTSCDEQPQISLGLV